MDLHIYDYIPCDFIVKILFLSFIFVLILIVFYILLIIMYILDIKDFKKKIREKRMRISIT